MNCIPYIYIRTRAREACEPSSRRNTLQMSRLAIIFFFDFSFFIFPSVRRGVRSAHPAPYPVLPSRRCTPRRCTPRRCTPRRCTPRRCTPRRCTPRNVVDALAHRCALLEPSSRRAVEPSSRRAVEPSSLCAPRRAFRRAPCGARNVGAGRVHRSPERRPSLETALHNRRNGLTLNTLRTQQPKLHKSCINTHKSPAYMQ